MCVSQYLSCFDKSLHASSWIKHIGRPKMESFMSNHRLDSNFLLKCACLRHQFFISIYLTSPNPDPNLTVIKQHSLVLKYWNIEILLLVYYNQQATGSLFFGYRTEQQGLTRSTFVIVDEPCYLNVQWFSSGYCTPVSVDSRTIVSTVKMQVPSLQSRSRVY